MRIQLFAVLAIALAGCSGKTPPCADDAVIAKVGHYAEQAIRDALHRNDPALKIEQIMSRIHVAVTNVAATDYERSIDKHTCSAALRVTLPPELAVLNEYRAFQTLALGTTRVNMEGNDIVTPIVYTSYLSKNDKQLIVYSEGDDVPAKYVKGAYKVGALDADLSNLPDLRAGLTLYSATEKNLLLEPVENGTLKFHIAHQSHMCRSWTQFITEERGDTLIYENRQVGCSLFFSRLGQIMLVEHEGCEMMAKACSPDGIYHKQ